MINDEAASYASEAMALTEQIAPLLDKRALHIQGAVLIQLMAKWLAAHPGPIRKDMLLHNLETLWELVKMNDFSTNAEDARLSGDLRS
jgi:hypothetical protein